MCTSKEGTVKVLALCYSTIIVHPECGKYPTVVFKRRLSVLVFLPDLSFHNRISQSTYETKSVGYVANKADNGLVVVVAALLPVYLHLGFLPRIVQYSSCLLCPSWCGGFFLAP